MTSRRIAGTHTISVPRRTAASTASATASGVVENGTGSRPAVIFDTTNPGRTMITRAPDPTRLSPRPCANPSRPAFDAP
jgi:hypothetical protein